MLGTGTYDTEDDDTVRNRLLKALSNILCAAPHASEQIASESVPASSIQLIDYWIDLHDVSYVLNLNVIERLQTCMRHVQKSMTSLDSVDDLETFLRSVLSLFNEAGTDEVYGHYSSTAYADMGDDGVRHVAFLLPDSDGNNPGRWWSSDGWIAYRDAIIRLVRDTVPCHVSVSFPTANAASDPVFYLDNVNDSEMGKDVTGQ
jgi:hypothetical protein